MLLQMHIWLINELYNKPRSFLIRHLCASLMRSPFLDQMSCNQTIFPFLQYKSGFFQYWKIQPLFTPLFFYLTVCCHVGCICQVPPQRCGRGNILGPDRTVGQQKQQEDACAEDTPVSGSTYGTECCSRLVLSVPVKQEFRSSPLLSLQHPVYCVNVVGTQNANNLISISTDGKMCSWSLDMLSHPQVINKLRPMVFLYNVSNDHLLIRFAWGQRLFLCCRPLSYVGWMSNICTTGCL